MTSFNEDLGPEVLYRPNLVVIPRIGVKAPPRRGQKPRPRKAWTLHRTDCNYAKRSNTAQPAPSQAYPNTYACTYCKPEQKD